MSLVSIQNSSPELNEKEMDAWHNLIRVLTHEIKNSLTPIASLAGSVEQIVSDWSDGGSVTGGTVEVIDQAHGRPKHSESVGKIRGTMSVIQKRSQGLLQFVDSYHNLTHIPSPDISVFPVSDLFLRDESLISPQLSVCSTLGDDAGSMPTNCPPVRLGSRIDPPTMKLTGDPRLIEQVLINLVINAIEATRGHVSPGIEMVARFDRRSRPVIEVIDNGSGIVTDSLEKVFVPFYSTKPEGMGIGLSWSRQILRLHRGDLIVTSEPGSKTVFSLLF